MTGRSAPYNWRSHFILSIKEKLYIRLIYTTLTATIFAAKMHFWHVVFRIADTKCNIWKRKDF